MQYRYFAAPMHEVKHQFVKNYGESQVKIAKTQDEFMNIVMHPIRHTAIILDTFLFFDLLTENNIYHLAKLEKYFEYIVFTGNNLEELHNRINGLKKLKYKRNKNKK